MSIDLDTIHLSTGGHDAPTDGACLLEAASMFAAEPFGDRPKCVSPLLREAGIALNDAIKDQAERDALKDLIPVLVTTAGDGLDPQRSRIAWEWHLHVWVPAWLDLTPALAEHAAALRATDPTDREATQRVLAAARDASAAARDAAWAAARDAAWAAAWAAARDAAWAAAGAAAWAAARDAAWAALRETSDQLRADFTVLFRRLVHLGSES